MDGDRTSGVFCSCPRAPCAEWRSSHDAAELTAVPGLHCRWAAGGGAAHALLLADAAGGAHQHAGLGSRGLAPRQAEKRSQQGPAADALQARPLAPALSCLAWPSSLTQLRWAVTQLPPSVAVLEPSLMTCLGPCQPKEEYDLEATYRTVGWKLLPWHAHVAPQGNTS